MNILIVEDDAATLSMLADFLKTMHMTPLIAKNGEEGLEMFRKFQPSLVITDIMMPKLDGLELVSTIKAESPDTYITIITALDNPEFAIESFKRGASSFLTKPFQPLDIFTIIQKQFFLFSESPTRLLMRNMIKEENVTLRLKNDYREVSAALEYLVGRAREYVRSGGVMGIRVALFEMLKNAMEHGNLVITHEEQEVAKKEGSYDNLVAEKRRLETYSSRKVEIIFTCQADCLKWAIRDEGEGFNYEQYLRPLEMKRMPGAGGKGIVISYFQMDTMRYEDGGRRVILEKAL